MCSKLSLSHWRRSGVFIVNLEHISHFLHCFCYWLWTGKCLLGMYVPTRSCFNFLKLNEVMRDLNVSGSLVKSYLLNHWWSTLNHSFPMHLFFTPWKHYGFLMLSGDRERMHWERMGKRRWNVPQMFLLPIEIELYLWYQGWPSYLLCTFNALFPALAIDTKVICFEIRTRQILVVEEHVIVFERTYFLVMCFTE